MGIGRRTEITVCAPCAGRVVSLDNVPDPAFAEKIVGDGVAIEPSEGEIYSPIEGTLEHLFKTRHAFSVSCGIAEILVHVGIESLTLNGEGFSLVKDAAEGESLSKSDQLIQVDLEAVRPKIPSLHTPVLITNYDEVQDFAILKAEGAEVKAGDPIFRFSMRKR